VQVVTAQLLQKIGNLDLSTVHMLDVGCGAGAWLRTFIGWGVNPKHAHGIDIIPERIVKAKGLSPAGIDFRVEDATSMPFADGSMDLVTSNTMFSSVLSPGIRSAIANEMRRVCKASGLVLVYDFRFSDPRNTDTVAIGRSELARLFPDCRLTVRSLTLAPPIARRLAPWSISLTAMLEWFAPFLRTHILAGIQPG